MYLLARAGGSLQPRPRQPFSRRDWLLVFTLSWAGFALPQVLLAIGIARSTGTNGALLSPLEPIGILIGGALFFRERLTSWRLARGGAGHARRAVHRGCREACGPSSAIRSATR